MLRPPDTGEISAPLTQHRKPRPRGETPQVSRRTGRSKQRHAIVLSELHRARQFREDDVVSPDQRRRRPPGEVWRVVSELRGQPGGALLQPSGYRARPRPGSCSCSGTAALTDGDLCPATPQERHGLRQQATSEARQGFSGLQSGQCRAARLLQR